MPPPCVPSFQSLSCLKEIIGIGELLGPLPDPKMCPLHACRHSVIRGLCPIVVMTFQVIAKRRLPGLGILGSVSLIVAGIVSAGTGDASFDLLGYLWVSLSVVFKAGNLLLVEHLAKSGIDATPVEMVLYDSLLSVPICWMASLISQEAFHIGGAISGGDAEAIWWLLSGVVVVGAIETLFLLLCTVFNSALTTSVVSTAKGLVTTVIGIFVRDAPTSALQISGYTLNGLGTILYSLCKYRSAAAGRNAVLFNALEEGMADVIMTNHDLASQESIIGLLPAEAVLAHHHLKRLCSLEDTSLATTSRLDLVLVHEAERRKALAARLLAARDPIVEEVDHPHGNLFKHRTTMHQMGMTDATDDATTSTWRNRSAPSCDVFRSFCTSTNLRSLQLPELAAVPAEKENLLPLSEHQVEKTSDEGDDGSEDGETRV